MRTKITLAIAAALVVGLLAIGIAAGVGGLRSEGPKANDQPTPTPTVVTVLAPIESAWIDYGSGSSALVIVSVLRNGCESFSGYEAAFEDGVIKVTITNTVIEGLGVFCTEIYGIVDTVIPLSDIAGLGEVDACITYRVEVNGKLDEMRPVGKGVRCVQPNPGDAQLGDEFTLGFGETGAVGDEGLQVTFNKVVEDSRCLPNTLCFWEGRATIRVAVSQNGEPLGERELTLSGADGANPGAFDGYFVKLLSLAPYSKNISADEAKYQATLLVTKTQCEE